MLVTEEIIKKVWEKGIIVTNNDPKYWRKDECGAWISRSQYGCQQSPFGWEINYIHPQTGPLGHDLPNLRPMQWQNNNRKQGDRTICVTRADGLNNNKITPLVLN